MNQEMDIVIRNSKDQKVYYPKPVGRLRVASGLILVEYEDEKKTPNLWQRFWYWFLLGWKWERM